MPANLNPRVFTQSGPGTDIATDTKTMCRWTLGRAFLRARELTRSGT